MATKPTPLSTFATLQPASPAPAASATSIPAPAQATDEKPRQKVFRLTPAQDRELKKYCAHSDTTIQDVVIEGINMVLKSKGLPPI